jgi:heat shock protein HslJ
MTGIAVCALSVWISGCASRSGDHCHEPTVMWGTQWRATHIGVEALSANTELSLVFVPAKAGVTGRARLVSQTEASAPNQEPSLELIDAGRMTGAGPCSSVSAPVALDRCEIAKTYRVVLGPMSRSETVCFSPSSEQESRYLGALQKAQRYEVKDGALLVHVEGMDQPLRFSRSAPRP